MRVCIHRHGSALYPRCLPCAAAVQAHCHYMVLKMFRDKVEQMEDPGVYAVMSTLARLYAVHGIGNFTGDFLQVRPPPSLRPRLTAVSQ